MSITRRLVLSITLFSIPVALARPARAQEVEPLPLRETAYELDLEVDYDEERIDGSARITVENHGESPVDTVPLVLYRTMAVEAVRDATGNQLDFDQDVTGHEEVPAWQVNAVWVRLPVPLTPGGRVTIEVDYRGWLFGYPEIMRYTRDTIDPAFTLIRRDTRAYPLVGVPSLGVLRTTPLPAFDYVARIRVPAAVPAPAAAQAGGDRGAEAAGESFSPVVANGGRLVSRVADGDHVVWTYANRRPAWRMDFAIADYGILETGEDRVYWLPGDSLGAERVMCALSAARRLYADWFGSVRSSRRSDTR